MTALFKFVMPVFDMLVILGGGERSA